jgi:Mn2+/Fe2+ NRAMP family transporter
MANVTRAGEETFRVRRIARRDAPGPAFSLSDEPLWRRVQLRFIAIGVFFTLAIAALVFRRLAERLSASILLLIMTVIAVVATLFVTTAWRRRRLHAQPAERGDWEAEWAASRVEEQLLAGVLSPHDLVYESARWGTLLESGRFGDVASEIEDKLNRSRRLKMGLMIVVGCLGALVLFGMLANFGYILEWLVLDRG